MMVDALPYSRACDNNKGPILEHLARLLADRREVLEIGGGTGQHATWFAGHLPHLTWQPTDLAENLPVLSRRCAAYRGHNLLPPAALDVCDHPWPLQVHDAVFTANTLHIMAFGAVEQLFAELGRRAPAGSLLCIYGPFNYGGRYTSDSNARFDQWLAQQSPHSAIRDFEAVDRLATGAGYRLLEDNAMPANNRLVVWRQS